MSSPLVRRELFGRAPPVSHLVSTQFIIDNLAHSLQLDAHEGCVNTLRWNHAGTLLASGSDDRTVCIWSVDGRLQMRFETGHTQNIFGVEFLPCGDDKIIVTAAGDHCVRLRDLGSDADTVVWRANGRVKRLATARDAPHECWSAAEDGFVREYDARTNAQNRIIRNERPVKTIAVCSNRTEMIATGDETESVLIYDRRHATAPVHILAPAYEHTEGASLLLPAHTTHVAFSQDGRQLIHNLSGGPVFVYDIAAQPGSRALEYIDQLTPDGPLNVEIDMSTLGFDEERQTCKDLFTEREYSKAMDAYSEIIPRARCPTARSVLLSNRAASLLARSFAGDQYACVRDCVQAVQLQPGNAKALYRLCHALCQLGDWKRARRVIELFKSRFPQDGTINRLTRICEDGELDGSSTGMGPDGAVDFVERYTGHVNVQTDIKEANFFGPDESLIVAGSDSGHMLVWERATGALRAAFQADDHILNIVQPHPAQSMLATSGLDDEIHIWSAESRGEHKCARRLEDPWADLDKARPVNNALGMQSIEYLLQRRAEGEDVCRQS